MSDYVLRIAGREYRATVEEITADQATIVVDGTTYEVDLVEIGRRTTSPSIARPTPRSAAVAAPPPMAAVRPSEEAPGAVLAPLPGLILRLEAKEGDSVQAGQPLVVMEAMKMENVVTAPYQGRLRKIFVAEGATVGEGEPLVEVARPKKTTL